MKSIETQPIPEFNFDSFNGIHAGLIIKKLEAFAGTANIIRQPHRANFLEIILVTGGSGNICIDSHKYSVEPSTLFASSNGPVKKFNFGSNITGFAVLFTPEFLYKYPEDLQWINSLTLFDPANDFNPIKLAGEIYSDILNLINKLDYELHLSDAFAREEILFNALKTLIILSERIKRTQATADIKQGNNATIVYEFKNLLEENFNNRRLVSFYADNLNITPRKLNKVVSEFYGKSAKQIIEERVLLEIKRLIIHTEKNIKEIGHYLGFNDPTNFNKFFKRYTKTTPADFRTSNKYQ